MSRLAVRDFHVSARNCGGGGKRARLDSVRYHAMRASVQRVHTLHANCSRAVPFYAGSHASEQVCQVTNLRLAGSIVQDGFPFGERRRHHEVFCAGHGHDIHQDVSSTETPRAGFDVTVHHFAGGPHLLQTH